MCGSVVGVLIKVMGMFTSLNGMESVCLTCLHLFKLRLRAVITVLQRSSLPSPARELRHVDPGCLMWRCTGDATVMQLHDGCSYAHVPDQCHGACQSGGGRCTRRGEDDADIFELA